MYYNEHVFTLMWLEKQVNANERLFTKKVNMNKINTKLIAKQQHRILKAAKNCFFNNGLTKTTMRDIAKEADISLGNIYRYFKNKNALIRAFIEIDNQDLDKTFALLDGSKNFKVLLQYIVKELIVELSKRAELCVYLEILVLGIRNDEAMCLLKLDKSEQYLKDSLQKANKEQSINLAMSPELTAQSIMGFIEKAAVKSICDPKYTVRKANKQFKQFLKLLIP